MTVDISELDAHEQPSEYLRALWKTCSKADQDSLLDENDIDDLRSPAKASEFRIARTIPVDTLNKSFAILDGQDKPPVRAAEDANVYYHPLLPGLLIVPSLIPPELQKTLLSRMVHDELSNPKHQTNMHLHFKLPYPDNSASFFTHEPEGSAMFEPKDPAVHKPLTVRKVMERKLHWVTFGGQYDWTNRVYPEEQPPEFPKDIAGLLESLFPETLAQAAIVNFYTPGDSMMMHRDVSEETNKGLVSVSIGCDGLFMISPNDIGKLSEEDRPKDDKTHLLLRLRSGDVIYMSEEARYAWHGVPKILRGTCPDYLEDWPAEEDGKFAEWRGWMKNKRINLNVRQMRD